MLFSIFARKPLGVIQAQAEDSEHGLHRSLTGMNLLLLGIGGIIGAGIFVLTGQAAAQYAGPAIAISFIISGIACTFAALCYAEMASMIPISGSAYTYAYATLGQLAAWIIGWDLVLEYLFGASTVAVGWSGYVTSFFKDFGYEIPAALSQAPFSHSLADGWQTTGAIVNLPAVIIVGLCTMLLYVGVRQSAWLNNGVVAVKLTVLALFLVFGAMHVVPSNWVPFLPENQGQSGVFGWSGVIRGAGVIFFAYIGFDSVSALAQETKNPQKDMPFGIIGSLFVCTVLYIAVSLVLTGVVKYDQLNVPDPIAVAVNSAGDSLRWLRPFIKVGAVAGLSSVVLVLLMAQPRILFSMARDGLLPAAAAKIHPRHKTPHVMTVATGILSAIIAGLFPIGVLGELVSIGTLLAFAIVCIGVLVLRVVEPSAHRPFRTPFVWVVSILGAASALMQMAYLPSETWLRLIAWMAIGLAIYFVYGRRRASIQ
jgi:basic amino acid/polyamine antiporter, APA family